MKLLLASRLASEALRLSLFSSAHPSTSRLRRGRETKGMSNGLWFSCLEGCLDGICGSESTQAIKRRRVLPLGVGLLFSRFCQSILTAMHLDWTCGNAFAEECRARVEKTTCKAIRPMCPISTSPEDVWYSHAAGTYSMELLLAFGKSSLTLESLVEKVILLVC